MRRPQFAFFSRLLKSQVAYLNVYRRLKNANSGRLIWASYSFLNKYKSHL